MNKRGASKDAKDAKSSKRAKSSGSGIIPRDLNHVHEHRAAVLHDLADGNLAAELQEQEVKAASTSGAASAAAGAASASAAAASTPSSHPTTSPYLPLAEIIRKKASAGGRITNINTVYGVFFTDEPWENTDGNTEPPNSIQGKLFHPSYPTMALRTKATDANAVRLWTATNNGKELAPLSFFNTALSLDHNFFFQDELDARSRIGMVPRQERQVLAHALTQMKANPRPLLAQLRALPLLDAQELPPDDAGATNFLLQGRSPRRGGVADYHPVAQLFIFTFIFQVLTNKVRTASTREVCSRCKKASGFCRCCDPKPDTTTGVMIEAKGTIGATPVTLWLFDLDPLLQLLSMSLEQLQALTPDVFQQKLSRLQGAHVRVGAQLKVGGIRAPYSTIKRVFGEPTFPMPNAQAPPPEEMSEEDAAFWAQLNA